jgi:transposase
MELRRICKYNYAVSYVIPFCSSARNCFADLLLSKEFWNMQKILLDFSKINGIIVLTHNAVIKEGLMARSPHTDPKEKALRDCGALNTHPVVDALFSGNDFFDSRDLVQVKYEMLRRVHKEGESVSRAATSFGFSRPSFYKTSGEFNREGVPGLLPRKRGPRRRHKLTAEVLGFVEGFSTGEHPMGIPALLDEVEKHFGMRVHRRSLERALGQYRKKTPPIPAKNQGKLP